MLEFNVNFLKKWRDASIRDKTFETQSTMEKVEVK